MEELGKLFEARLRKKIGPNDLLENYQEMYNDLFQLSSPTNEDSSLFGSDDSATTQEIPVGALRAKFAKVCTDELLVDIF